MITKLVAIADQLKSDLEKGEADPNMSVPDFLQYLKKYDIIYDKTDLYDMIKNPPLNGLITNIQGDNVIFKGKGEAETNSDQSQSQKVVGQMAQSAMK